VQAPQNATSISRLVLARRSLICSPIARAAGFDVSQRGLEGIGAGRIGEGGHVAAPPSSVMKSRRAP
jgi:hypothetical protein